MHVAVKVLITIAIGITVSVFLGASLVNSLVAPVIDPRVTLVSPQFTSGPCQTDYFLWFRTGEHQMVTATFVLKNSGLTDGRATVTFTADGARTGSAEFFIGAGQSETKSAQFRVDDCQNHQYWAQLGDVSRK